MSVLLSIIIQERNEGRPFVRKMVEQVSRLTQSKELIFVTSSKFAEFYSKYGPFNYGFPVSVIGGIHSPGSGRSIGTRAASGEILIYMDCHVCFTPDKINKLLQTLNRHPTAVIAPSLQGVDFPSCASEGGIAYGVSFSFIDQPYRWDWMPPTSNTQEYKTPFVCACQFMANKKTMDHVMSYGGFLTPPTGVGMEEEIFMRLQRLGHEVYLDPTVTMGHMFKGYPGKPQWDEHSGSGWFYPRVASIYVNVFDNELYRKIESISTRVWGDIWYKHLETAKKEYSWLRYQIKPLASKIDENWFFRT